MDELCGNKKQYENIKNWITTFYELNRNFISFNSCIFISGNSGIGKTYSINIICKLLLQLWIIIVT